MHSCITNYCFILGNKCQVWCLYNTRISCTQVFKKWSNHVVRYVTVIELPWLPFTCHMVTDIFRSETGVCCFIILSWLTHFSYHISDIIFLFHSKLSFWYRNVSSVQRQVILFYMLCSEVSCVILHDERVPCSGWSDIGIIGSIKMPLATRNTLT